MPLLLYSYITAEIAGPFLASLAILTGVMFTGKLMQMIDMIFRLHIGFADFLRLLAYLAPNLLLFAIPMAGTLAVIIAFTRLSNDNEIIALKASGLNLYRLLPPVFIFAMAASLLSGFISTQLIPVGEGAMQNLFVRVTTEKIDKGIQAKRFSEETGDMVIYVDAIDPDSQQWQGVYLSDLSDRQTPTTIIAKQGSIAPHMDKMYVSIELNNGTMHRSTSETVQTVVFDRYQVDIPIEQPTQGRSNGPHNLNKNWLSQSELLAHAGQSGTDPLVAKGYLVEYHLRIVLAVGTLILSLLGMPIALRSKASRRNIGIPVGLTFFILYFTLITAAKGLCDKTALPVGLVMWLPNMLFAAITLLVMYITASEKWDMVLRKMGVNV